MTKTLFYVYRSRQEHPDWWVDIGGGWVRTLEEAMDIANKHKSEHKSDNVKIEKVTTEIIEVK